ncbi:MAG: WbqC family protein [Flavitalea sp.]
MTLIADIQYFSPVIFYIELSCSTNCILDQYEPYRKMSFRNRCVISGANGTIHLSIPLVEGRTQKRIMKEVRISNSENWQARHWKTITACYNRSPWFEFYRDELEGLYLSKADFLVDWNWSCFNWISSKMALKTPVALSEQYHPVYDAPGCLDWRSHLLPATINQLYPSLPRYAQVFEDRLGFIPNLSVLDKLFCQGPKG